MQYSADIAHCSGYLCPLAEKCKRWNLLLMWDKMPMEERNPRTVFMSSEYNNDTGNCEYFIQGDK